MLAHCNQISEMESHFEECPPKMNILVVDNSFTTLLNMKRIITQYNYQVMIETNGESALAFLRNTRHEINLVIWDLHMPGINGIEALKAIGSEMDLAVIIMSDDDQYESVREAIYHGACDYIMKPVPNEKIAFIWQHIVRKKMKSKLVSTPVPDLARSGRLDHVKADSTRSGSHQEHNTEIRNEEKSAESTAWTEVKIQPFRRDLVQTNDVDKQNEHSITINQDNGEVNNAAKEPRTEETQVVQTYRLQTEALDQDSADSKILSKGNKGEGNMGNKKEKKAQRPRLFWTRDLHQRFLEAIELIGGIDNATPRILLRCMEDMKIEGVTRYNVTSHLQKYRVSLAEAEIAKHQMQEFGSSSSLLAPNNVQTASSSSLLNGQAMNPMQQNQYQSGSLTMNNNQFITDPDQSGYLTNLPYLDCLRDPKLQQYLFSNQHLLFKPYQSANQELQSESANQKLHYQSADQELQYQSANPELQQSANPEQVYQSANEQASDDISATDVELINPSLPYDPKEFLINGHNVNL